MSKWIRSLALAAAVATGTAGLVTVGGTPVYGQVKDPKTKPVDPKTKDPVKPVEPKAKDPVKPVEPKPTEAKGSVVITKDKQGKFRFQVRDEDDKVVMMCVKGYDTEKAAVEAFTEALAIAKSSKPALEKTEK